MELKYKTSIRSTARCDLLIVPYGIEIRQLMNSMSHLIAFNRTLWN